MTPALRPHRASGGHRLVPGLAALAVAAALCVCSLSAHPDDMRAVTALTVNGLPAGDTMVVRQENATWIPVESLSDAGLQTTGGVVRTMEGRPYVSLESLAPDVSFEFDELEVVLRVRAVGRRFGANDLRLSTVRPEGIERTLNTSGFVNYAATFAEEGQTLAAEAGINVRGWLLHGSLSRDARGDLLRGPVSVTRDDERRLRRWEVGDASLSGGAFGGIVPIAGVTVSRQFGIDPYFVQYTPLQLTGTAATPSVADVYVNGQLVRRVPIAPGSFTLSDLPVAVGAGQAEVVVRDAFGREQRFGSSFYTPASVLRPGLQEYQYGVGVQRAAFGTRLWDYDGPVVSGQHRIGVREGLTLGGRIEASRELAGLAPSLAMRLPVGEMETIAAVSRADGQTGGAGLVAWSYRGRLFNASLSWRGTTREYASLGERLRQRAMRDVEAELAAASAAQGLAQNLIEGVTQTVANITRVPSVRSDVQASVGWSATSRLNLTAQYARLRRWNTPLAEGCDASASSLTALPVSALAAFGCGGGAAVDTRAADAAARALWGPEERLLLGASWQMGGRLGLSASVGRSRSAGRSRTEAFVGLNIFFRERLSGSVGVSRGSSSGASVALQRSPPIGPGYGYRVQWQSDPRDVGIDLQAQGGPGRVELRSTRLGDGGAVSASVMGALAMVGGRVYATRPIDDAFALVRVSDVPGVRAFASNQYIGKTDRRGDVLVPNLVSYYGNRLSIAAEDVPLTHEIGVSERVIAPSLRGGALVRFAAPTRLPVTGRFVLADAVTVPAFGEARTMTLRDAEVSPLGRLGEFYFERLEPGARLVSLRFGGRWYDCPLLIPAQPDPTGRAIDLGTIVCREPQTRTEASR